MAEDGPMISQWVTFHTADRDARTFVLSIEDTTRTLEEFHDGEEKDPAMQMTTTGGKMFHFNKDLVICIEVEATEDADARSRAGRPPAKSRSRTK